MRTFDASDNGGGWFPGLPCRNEDAEKAARIAWENRPSVVFREIAMVLGGTAAFVIAVNVLLAALHIS